MRLFRRKPEKEIIKEPNTVIDILDKLSSFTIEVIWDNGKIQTFDNIKSAGLLDKPNSFRIIFADGHKELLNYDKIQRLVSKHAIGIEEAKLYLGR